MKACGIGVVICIGLVLCGCSWSRMKINDENIQARAQTVKPMVTKASELPKLMGTPPNNILPLKNGKQVFVYTNGDSKSKGFNIVLIGISKTNTRMDSTYFLIGENDVVESVVAGQPGDELPWEWWAFGE